MEFREDIALVVHCYDIGWAKDLNKALSEIFYNPFVIKERSYLAGRTQQMQYMSLLIEKMRSKKIKKVFFANYVDDFSNNFIKGAFVKEIFGFLHTSNKMAGDVGGDKRLINYESGIIPLANKLFCATEFAKGFFNHNKINMVGLPLINDFKKPKIDNNNILFNHRLAVEKGYRELKTIKDEYCDRFMVTSPKGAIGDIPKLRKKYKNFQFKPSNRQYQDYINKSSFCVSFASAETFGVSVQEAIANGLCVLVPNHNNSCYKQTIIDELRFNDMEEFYSKLDNLTNNVKERERLIIKQQKKSAIYKKDTFLNSILNNIN